MVAASRPPPHPAYRFHVQREDATTVKVIYETFSLPYGWKPDGFFFMDQQAATQLVKDMNHAFGRLIADPA